MGAVQMCNYRHDGVCPYTPSDEDDPNTFPNCKECNEYKKAAVKPVDNVNHPSHYTFGKFECIDVIFDILSTFDDPVSAWLTGQIVKYIWRWPHKNGVEDLKKTRFYLDRLIKHEEEKGAKQ